MASSFLDRIMPATRQRLAERQSRISEADLLRRSATLPPARDFAAALRPTDGGLRVICEFKRASPSKGAIGAGADPRTIAGIYARDGAAAISVLTEQDFFQGDLADLDAIRAVTDVPILRKDFIIDPYQVIEARAHGAESFLLIAALLDDATLAALLARGREFGMEALVETHDAAEVRRAVSVGAKIIGVNARDLHTFTVDTTLLARLRSLIPADRVVVAESGIASVADLARRRGDGADAVLIGETAMHAAADPASTLLQRLTHLPAALQLAPRRSTIVKLCGMRSVADALAAHDAGTDFIGMIFATGRSRHVEIETARKIVQALPRDTFTAGVFAHESLDQIRAIVGATGVRLVQMPWCIHAAEDLASLGLPVILTLGPGDTPGSSIARSRASGAGGFRHARDRGRQRQNRGLGDRRQICYRDAHPAGGWPDARKRRRGHPRRASLGRGCQQRH